MLKDLFKLYGKSLIVLSPLLIILGSFIIIDPFGIIHNEHPVYESSDDYVTTENYLANTETITYNSFIFGNSKTLGFRSVDWKKHVTNGEYYKFGAPGESIFNIYNKIKLILRERDSLSNVLIILDPAMIRNYKNTTPYLQGPVYKHHPLTQDENKLTFYGSFFKFYLSDFFFLKVLRETLSGNKKEAEGSFIQTTQDFNPRTNEFYLIKLENEISQNGFNSYYKNHEKEFANQMMTSKNDSLSLNKGDIEYLTEMNLEFKKRNTDFKIIMGPIWAGKQFPANAKQDLINIFGKNRVYDFSNDYRLTKDSSNFYEYSHYRPIAGALILNEIYKDSLR